MRMENSMALRSAKTQWVLSIEVTDQDLDTTEPSVKLILPRRTQTQARAVAKRPSTTDQIIDPGWGYTSRPNTITSTCGHVTTATAQATRGAWLDSTD